MAPLPTHLLFKRSTHHSTLNSGGGGNADLAYLAFLVLLVFVVVAVGAYWYELDKAKKLHASNGTPYSKAKIARDAILIGLTLGLVACICGEARNVGNPGGDTGAQAGQQVQPEVVQAQPQPQMDMPAPSMNWAPVQEAASAPIQ